MSLAEITRPGGYGQELQADEDGVVIEGIPGAALEAQTRGEIDIQIKTARAYPRSIRTFLQSALEMATLDQDTAERCFYALPRQGKTIEGPSARLAEIVASAWGHMRVESKIVENDGRFLTARGVAWDLQNNVAVATEVRRRITDRNGRTFNDDMIMVTANAACSIARRNAVFAVVPNSYTRQIYERCRAVAIGDASTLVNNRAKVLKALQQMGATPDRVFARLGIKGEEDITLDHLAVLKGAGNAIRDGDTSVDEAFPDPRALAAAEAAPVKGSEALKAKLKSNGADAGRETIAEAPAPVEEVQEPAPPAPTEKAAPALTGAQAHLAKQAATVEGAPDLSLDVESSKVPGAFDN